MKDKRVFGYFELVFDVLYLGIALVFGFIMLNRGGLPVQMLAGVMSLVLVGGDAFHLVPRIASIVERDDAHFRKSLGIGKFITSITMTVFYVLMWHIGLLMFSPENATSWTICIYVLAAMRIVLCLLPQNKWLERKPPVSWGIFRNLPFIAQGILVSLLFRLYGGSIAELEFMWLAIVLSFAFYIPVVLWSNKVPALGMLMLPKTCMYLWMLWMCLFIK